MRIKKWLQVLFSALVCVLTVGSAAQSSNYTISSVARNRGQSTFLPPDNTERLGAVVTPSYLLQPNENSNSFTVGINVPADGNLGPIGTLQKLEWLYYVANRGPMLSSTGLQVACQTSTNSVYLATSVQTTLIGTSQSGTNIYSIRLDPESFAPPIPNGETLRRFVLRYRGNQQFRISAPDIYGTRGSLRKEHFRFRTVPASRFAI